MCCEPPRFVCVCVCAHSVDNPLTQRELTRLHTLTTGDLSEKMVWLDSGGPHCINLHINEEINQALDGAARVLLVCNCDIINNHVTQKLIKSRRLSLSSRVSAPDLTKMFTGGTLWDVLLNLHARTSVGVTYLWRNEDTSKQPEDSQSAVVEEVLKSVWSKRYHRWNTGETWLKSYIWQCSNRLLALAGFHCC